MRKLRLGIAVAAASQVLFGSGLSDAAEEDPKPRTPYRQFEPRIPSNYEKVLAASSAQATAPVLARSGPGGLERQVRTSWKPRYWYAGVGAGRSAFDADVGQANAGIAATGATAFSVTAHGYDGGWKLYAGYWLTSTLSVEGGYWNFGGPRFTASVTAPVTTSFDRGYRGQGLGLDLVGWNHASESVSIFGRIGLMYTAARAGAVSPGGGLAPLSAETVRTVNLHPGAGLRYRFSDDFSARFEYEYVPRVGKASSIGRGDIHFWSLGLGYSF